MLYKIVPCRSPIQFVSDMGYIRGAVIDVSPHTVFQNLEGTTNYLLIDRKTLEVKSENDNVWVIDKKWLQPHFDCREFWNAL